MLSRSILSTVLLLPREAVCLSSPFHKFSGNPSAISLMLLMPRGFFPAIYLFDLIYGALRAPLPRIQLDFANPLQEHSYTL